MAARRPMGALEDGVIEYLWAIGAPTAATAVHSAVAPELAYTTVTTVLTRLCEKGRVDRTSAGRSYLYAAVVTEAEHRAGAMSTTLEGAGNRSEVLTHFVDVLDSEDLAVLRDLLGRS
jgi:predicted transcriptional regulator